MSRDLLEKLAETTVPPVPEQFDHRLHQRLNRTLLGTHLTDFLVHGFLFACGHMARAFVGLVLFTLSGRFEDERRRPPTKE